MVVPNEDEFEEFMTRIEQVSKTITGLKEGTVSVPSADAVSAQLLKEEEGERLRREARRRLKVEEHLKAQAEREDQAVLREVHKDKVEELKRDYYHRKNRRERWEEHRKAHPTNTMDYRGWELFEEDPDEDLWNGETRPQVQDQPAFDAMAKDVEERSARRVACKLAADAERARGNAALKAGQFGEALARYGAAMDHDKGDKGLHTNRALAHLKVGNYLSAAEDCSKALEICEWLDDCLDASPIHPVALKAYMRRAAAYNALGRYDDADADVRRALRTASEADVKELRKLQREVEAERAAAKAEEAALGAVAAATERAAGGGGGGGGADKASVARVHSLCEALQAGTALAAPKPVGAKGGRAVAGVPSAAALPAATNGMRRIRIEQDDDDQSDREDSHETEAGTAAGTAAAGADEADAPGPGAPPSARPDATTAAEPAAARVGRERAYLRELRALALAAEAHRATLRGCGLIGWMCGKLGASHAGLALDAALALGAACLSARGQRELVARGGLDRLLLLLAAEPAASAAVLTAGADACAPAPPTAEAAARAALAAARALCARWRLCKSRLEVVRLCALTEGLHPQLVAALGARRFLGRLAALGDDADADAPPAGAGGAGGGGALAGALLEARAARSAAALSALGCCAQLSADGKFKSALVAAAVGSRGAAADAGGADVIGLLASAARADGAPASFPLSAVRAERQRAAVQALGNLSSSPRLRALFAQLSLAQAVRDTALRTLGAAAGESAARSARAACGLDIGAVCFLANAAAALHNLCADDAAADECASPLVGPLCALLRRADVRADAELAGRFLALLGKAARLPGVPARLLEGGALEIAAALLDAHAERATLGAPALPGAGAARAPRFEEVGGDGDDADAAAGPAAADADEAANGVARFDVVGPALKVLTTLLHADATLAAAVCERGSIPTLVRLLRHESDHVRGNAALCVSELARDERSLAVLAVQPQLVESLLDVAHHKKGQLQRNAAICLARLAKNARCMQLIRDNHGMEILMQYVKPTA